jgi:hypothetical protein
VILEYGDYECPYSRLAFREIERVDRAIKRKSAISTSASSRRIALARGL